MPVTHKKKHSVTVRLYGVGLDALDAFKEDAELYPSWNAAKHKAKEELSEVYSVVLDIPFDSITKQ